jgi:hypothetical protein
MGVARRIGIAVVTATLAAGSGVGHGDNASQPADTPGAGLLEFLGSVDPATDSKQQPDDDGSWLAYLSQIDIGKVAKASQASQAPQPPGQTKPTDSQPAADKPGG